MAERGPNLSGRDVEDVHLSNARVRRIDMVNSHVTGAFLLNARIDGDFEGLVMNGVEVAPLIRAELKKRHPILAKNNATSAEALRECLEEVYAIWDGLEARAAAIDETALHERVDDEWSFVETMRHLVYATDVWFRHGILDLADACHSLALPHSEDRDDPRVDASADPSYAEVLAVRRQNQAQLREFLAPLDDGDVARTCSPTHPGHPGGTFTVGQAIWVVNNEEFWHSTYAERDLSARAGLS
ncbi:MAG: hypothetical protein QOG90_662 [Actinomycetota bacterium]